MNDWILTGSFVQLAQENPDPPQPAGAGPPSGTLLPPTLKLEADSIFFISLLLQESQETELVSVEERICSNSFPHELQINS